MGAPHIRISLYVPTDEIEMEIEGVGEKCTLTRDELKYLADSLARISACFPPSSKAAKPTQYR